MDRYEKLQQKHEEILSELRAWAERESILEPGENIDCGKIVIHPPSQMLTAEEWDLIFKALTGRFQERVIPAINKLVEAKNRPLTRVELFGQEKFNYEGINVALKRATLPFRLRNVKEPGSKEPVRFQIKRTP